MNDGYNSSKSCKADNLILNWKGFHYQRINASKTNYTFLNNSIKKSESCKKGFKKCGILDELENILCIPDNESCPINYIKFSKDMENSSYNYAEIGEEKKIYFSNETRRKISDEKKGFKEVKGI